MTSQSRRVMQLSLKDTNVSYHKKKEEKKNLLESLGGFQREIAQYHINPF